MQLDFPARRVGPWLIVALVAALLTAPAAGASQLDPPRNLRVTALTQTTATIQWDAPPGADEETWYRVETSRGWQRSYKFAVGPSVTVTSLYPGQPYEVRVETLFEVNWSEPVAFQTLPVIPPPTPENVTATVTPGSVTVEWEPSFLDGVEADWYVVRWTPQHSGVVTKATSMTRSLPPGGELSVTVAARKGVSYESPRSAPLELLVPPHPDWEPLGTPTNFRLVADAAGHIQRFEWDPPPGGMDPVTYVLNYRFGDQPEEPFIPIADSNQAFLDVPATIGRLSVCGPNPHPGSTWIIRVNARSHGEVSEPSNELMICL